MGSSVLLAVVSRVPTVVYRAGAVVSHTAAGSARSCSVTTAYRPAAAVYRGSFGS
jgi:hypothetical protein